MGHFRPRTEKFWDIDFRKTPIFRELWDIPSWARPSMTPQFLFNYPLMHPSILLHTSGGWSGWQHVSHLPGQGEGPRV